MARTARTLKVVLTEGEAVQLRASVLIRLHVERVNGGGPQDAMLSALLVKLGYTAHLPRVAPPEGGQKGWPVEDPAEENRRGGRG